MEEDMDNPSSGNVVTDQNVLMLGISGGRSIVISVPGDDMNYNNIPQRIEEKF